MKDKNNIKASNLMKELKKYKTINQIEKLSLEDLLYKDETGKTLLEYMLDNKIEYNFALVPRISQTYKSVKIMYDYGKIEDLWHIDTEVYLTNITENKLFIEELIETKTINKIHIISFEYDARLIKILKKYNRLDLINKIIFSEAQLFSTANNKLLIEELLEEDIIDYINFEEITSHPEIIDILKKYNRLDLLNKIIFSEDILLKEDCLLKEIINLGYTPIMKNCKRKTLEYLYKINRPDIITKLFKEQENINLLFSQISINETTLEYILNSEKEGIKINLREIIMNINYLEQSEFIDVYLTFIKYDKLEYLQPLTQNELLKPNKKGICLLDIFISRNLEATKKLLKYSDLETNIDIIIYFKIKGIKFEDKEINFELFDNNSYSYEFMVYQNELLKQLINYKEFNEEMKDLLFELEVLMIDLTINKEMLEALILSYAKEISKNNENAIIELKKLIQIKKQHPQITITRDYTKVYFSKNKGLFLSTVDINTINHELGHLFHYFLANNETPIQLEKIIQNLRLNSNIKEKIYIVSKNIKDYIEYIKPKIEEEYDKWAEEYFTEEMKQIIKQNIENEKNKKIEKYRKLGYLQEELEIIFNTSYTLEEYMKSQKRIKCYEMQGNIMDIIYPDLQAICDIIDAIYQGEFYDSKLITNSGEIIKGSYGHGIAYYQSIDSIFEELIANYSQLTKSDNKEKSLELLTILVGEELVNLLKEFYEEKIINSDLYNTEKTLKL